MVDIMTFGNATIDVILQSDQFKVSKDKRFSTGYAESFAFGSKIDVQGFYQGVGGGGLNTAITFARQGMRVGYVGKVSTDLYGNQIVEKLAAEAIKTDYVLRDEQMQSPYSTVLLDKSGERTVLTFRGIHKPIPKATFSKDFPIVSWFFITSLGGDIDLLEYIIAFAMKNRIKVALNPGAKELEDKAIVDILPKVDVLFLNTEETQLLMKTARKGHANIFQTFCGLTKAIVVVTNGNRGAGISDGRTLYYIPNADVEVIDRLGAGDAFGSGFVTGLIQRNGDIEYALRVANANAGSVCATLGANDGIIHLNDRLPEITITKHDL